MVSGLIGLAYERALAVPWPAAPSDDRDQAPPGNGCRLSPIEAPGFTGLAVVPWLAVLWPAGCRDRERLPAGSYSY